MKFSNLRWITFSQRTVDLTTEPGLEDEEASRNEESIEVNNAESVEQAMVEKMRDSDLFKGSRVKDDDEYPLWKPDGCDLPCISLSKSCFFVIVLAVIIIHIVLFADCEAKVPALVLDCEPNIDFSRNIEAKRQYARQVPEFFEFVKKKQETSQEQSPLLMHLHNGGLWMGPEGKNVPGLELSSLDFRKVMSFLTRPSA
ncbi:hypothetical protein Bca4012_063555 [Brassica carinata]